MAPLNGAGRLRRVLEAAKDETGLSAKTLTVLAPQNDPYRADTPANHRDGAWCGEQVERFARGQIHCRGLHYAIVATGDVVKPNGEVYRNTDDDWIWLQSVAVKAARWLGYVPFHAIKDERNDPPQIHSDWSGVRPWPDVSQSEIPSLSLGYCDLKPGVFLEGDFEGIQPYHLVIFGEKSSVGGVVAGHGADLYLPSGEISDTLLYRMATENSRDRRPMIVFTVADCDPAGHQMPISIGRKLQALRDLEFPDMEFEVRPIALTVDQVRELGLPSTPLKDTEKRADKWREAFGVEQTEIDALAQLQPDVLRQIVRDAVAPFYDRSLTRRARQAQEDWEAAAQEILDANTDHDAIAVIRAEAEALAQGIQENINSLNDRLSRTVTLTKDDLPPIEIPEPIVDSALYGKPLIASDWGYADIACALIARKQYR